MAQKSQRQLRIIRLILPTRFTELLTIPQLHGRLAVILLMRRLRDITHLIRQVLDTKLHILPQLLGRLVMVQKKVLLPVTIRRTIPQQHI